MSRSGGLVTHPAGAVHRLVLWAGDLSTADASSSVGCQYGPSLMGCQDASSCSESTHWFPRRARILRHQVRGVLATLAGLDRAVACAPVGVADAVEVVQPLRAIDKGRPTARAAPGGAAVATRAPRRRAAAAYPTRRRASGSAPRGPSWSCPCCRWCSAWSRATCWPAPG